jgi:hypothetical protein
VRCPINISFYSFGLILLFIKLMIPQTTVAKTGETLRLLLP